MNKKLREHLINEISGKDMVRRFMGQANDNMANLLTAIEDTIDRDYMDDFSMGGLEGLTPAEGKKREKKGKKLNAAMIEVDKDWEKLWSKIVKIIKQL
jgi:hypothetical protein